MLKIFRYAFYTVLAVVSTGYVSFKFYEYRFYSNAIPKQIDLGRIIEQRSEGNMREGCGGVIFKISNETLSKISSEGVSFLDRDLIGRGYKENTRKALYYTYKPWKKSPMIINESSFNPGLECLLKNNKELRRSIAQIYGQDGAYYTTKDEAQLLLIPSMGFLIFVYFG